MNTNLLYAKASYMGFVNNDEWMDNSLSTFKDTQSLTKDDVFAMANQCRKGSKAIFADESNFLPTNKVSGDAGAVVVSSVSVMPVVAESMPTTQAQPQQQSQTQNQSIPNQISNLTSQLSPNEKLLLEGIGIGIGIMVLFKMLA
jgi:hypothetical protein